MAKIWNQVLVPDWDRHGSLYPDDKTHVSDVTHLQRYYRNSGARLELFVPYGREFFNVKSSASPGSLTLITEIEEGFTDYTGYYFNENVVRFMKRVIKGTNLRKYRR